MARPPLEVAPALLGAVLTSTVGGGPVSVRLTEVEAYAGPDDPGSHGFRGRTARNAALFGPPGTVYVYFTYGMHFCANIVCGHDGEASAVLLRAGEVVAGNGTARGRSPRPLRERDLASGPARLARSLGLTLAQNGTRIGLAAAPAEGAEAAEAPSGPGEGLDPDPPVLVLSGWGLVEPERIARGPRVGVAGPGGSDSYPWRFWIDADPTVSRYRPAAARGRTGAVLPNG